MKQIRKISLVIVLALVLTIGSVFAAWHYDRGAVSLETTRSATMASVISSSVKGEVSIDIDGEGNARNTIKFLVDDTGEIDWVAALISSGSVWVKFTPSTTAEPNVRENGLKLQATVTVTGLMDQDTEQIIPPTKYKISESDSVAVFSAKAENTFVLNNGNYVKDQAVEITAAQIANCLLFNEGRELILDTYAKNLAYESAMKTYVITITITEVPA